MLYFVVYEVTFSLAPVANFEAKWLLPNPFVISLCLHLNVRLERLVGPIFLGGAPHIGDAPRI